MTTRDARWLALGALAYPVCFALTHLLARRPVI